MYPYKLVLGLGGISWVFVSCFFIFVLSTLFAFLEKLEEGLPSLKSLSEVCSSLRFLTITSVPLVLARKSFFFLRERLYLAS